MFGRIISALAPRCIYSNEKQLRLSASCGDVTAVSDLLAHGARADVTGKDGRDPLTLAMDGCHLDVILILRKHMQDVKTTQEDALHWAARMGAAGLVEKLMILGVQGDHKDDQGKTAMFIAVESDNLDVVEVLLRYGADVRVTSRSSPNENDRDVHMTPMFLAIESDKPCFVRRLLEAGSLLTSDSPRGVTYSAINFACFAGNLGTVKLLLEQGADINKMDTDHGYTPLMCAVDLGHTAIAVHLIENWADYTPRTTQYSNETALEMAVSNNQAEMIEGLKQGILERVRRRMAARVIAAAMAKNVVVAKRRRNKIRALVLRSAPSFQQTDAYNACIMEMIVDNLCMD